MAPIESAGMKQDEYAVIGLGRFGSSLARELSRLGSMVLVVDNNPSKVQDLSVEIEQALVLDATCEDAVRSSGIAEFGTVVVCIGEDFESNILVTNLLKELGCERVISKALSRRQRSILLKSGADTVVLPEMEAGERLAQALVDHRSPARDPLPTGLSLTTVSVRPEWTGKKLGDIGLGQNIKILAVQSSNQASILMPNDATSIASGQELVIVGLTQAIQAFC